MLIFSKIRWKNFLSTGNVFTEIQLNKDRNTIIVGKNGSGKSTLLDALTFVLFGKPFRKINKPTIVNSQNERDCLVEIEFTTNGKSYRVSRGIKPNVFEIYCDGNLLNQDSASKDYQEFLEKYILQMSYKSFTQIVILGSASFTPFMQLSSLDRRNVIEDLLDINVFSVMNIITKTKAQTNREAIEKNRLELSGKEEKKSFVERNIKNLKQNNQDIILSYERDLSNNSSELMTIQTGLQSLRKKQDELLIDTDRLSALKDKHRKMIGLQSKMESNLKRHQKSESFYHENDDCPTCLQSIDVTFKDKVIKETENKIQELSVGMDKITAEIDKLVDTIRLSENSVKKCNDIRNEMTRLETKEKSILVDNTAIKSRIDQLRNSDTVLQQNEKELQDLLQDIQQLNHDREQLLEDRLYIDTALNLLKDGGIKTKIIKQYLPVINKSINKYLSQMGFFANFEINEQFEETIRSRFQDVFSYENFSEGEKFRIDLALLLTWRYIAKMKNNCATNLLIMDELFDSSLDIDGTDEFVKIMQNLGEDTNIFIISHKVDQLVDRFQKIYRFEKRHGFSSIVS